MKTNPLFLLLCFLLLGSSLRAGYRVYEHRIDVYNNQQKKTHTFTRLTTLDALQYEHYHAGYGRFLVTMLDTWFCPGDTRHLREYCQKPKPKKKYSPWYQRDPKRYPLDYTRQPIINR